MRAWMKTPGHEGHTVIIPNDLGVMQQLVGGYIEAVTIVHPDLVIICNEEGKLRGLPYNCTIDGVDFVGTIVAGSVDGNKFASIGADSVEYLNGEVEA